MSIKRKARCQQGSGLFDGLLFGEDAEEVFGEDLGVAQYEADAEYDEQHSERDCSGDEDFEDYVFFAVVEEPFFEVGHCWEEEVVE